MKNSDLFRLLCQSLVLDEYPEMVEVLEKKLKGENVAQLKLKNTLS